MENEFRRHYKEHVMPALQKHHGYKNVHQIPKVEKVVINTSVGSQSDVALDFVEFDFWENRLVRNADRVIAVFVEAAG